MKTLLTALVIIAICVFALAPTANVAGLEPFGKLELSGGGEKEARSPGGGRFTAEGLGVLPLMGNLGAQGSMHYVTGLGSRVGFSFGPVYGWDRGKIGGFLNYQYRAMRGNHFVHLIPSIAFYFDQANLNFWYAQPVNGAQRGGDRVEYGVNRLQGALSYYPGSDWATFLRKDNVELTLGLQVNTFAGAGHQKLGGTGVGPTIGASFLPMPGVAVNLIRANFDNRGRYRVNTGIEFFFDRRGNTTLKEARRKYLEPNSDLPPSSGQVKHASSLRGRS